MSGKSSSNRHGSAVERLPQQPPTIAPITGGIKRPLWSVMIPAYNCSAFLRETINSVLEQDLGAEVMQIEVVDDASTDGDVRAIVEEAGKGRVTYFRQSENVGSLRNFETCINRATGNLIHLLHGDDLVRNGYYKKIGELYNRFPNAGAFFCSNGYIDELGRVINGGEALQNNDGILTEWLQKISTHQRLQYVAIAVKREVYEQLGSFYAVTYGEDWEMWARIAKHFPVAYTPEVLADYRLHFNSISGGSYASGQNIRSLKKVIKLISQLFDGDEARTIGRLARKNVAYNNINFLNFVWNETGNRRIIYRQLFESLKLYCDYLLLRRSAFILYHIVRRNRVV